MLALRVLPKRKQPLLIESYAGGLIFRRMYYYSTGRIVIGHSGALSGVRLTGTSYGAELMQIVESGQVEVSSIPWFLYTASLCMPPFPAVCLVYTALAES